MNSEMEQQIAELKKRLAEAEETLDAIRRGSIDALVVRGDQSQRVYTLRSADYTYRRLVESMNQGALTLNFDGMILYSNQQFSAMVATPLEQIIGNNFLNYVTPLARSVVEQFLRPGASEVDTVAEISLRSAAGTEIPAIVSATTVDRKEVKPYLCIVLTDLTERKRSEEAKDEFISLASHQLRTPATAIKQYLSMLEDGTFGRLNETQLSAVKKAYEGNERALKIVEDLLRVAQIDAGKIVVNSARIDINELITAVASEQVRRITARGQKLALKLSAGPVVAYGDAYLVRMVVENLLDNASKYMDEGGTITISSGLRKGRPTFSIADEGVGIHPDDLSKLFHKFSRLPNDLSVKVGGTGLGLYWVKKVLDLHEAKVEVTANQPKGTTFTVVMEGAADNA